MKIAGVSMTYNDGYKLKEWREHYETYKNQLEVFVIVDNGSEKEFKKELKDAFPDAVVVEREINGGCTAAYNDGISYVLKNTDIEAIAILGNDIKVTNNCLPVMYSFLFEDPSLGIVSTAILDIDSDVIDNYGHNVDDFKVTCCNKGESIKTVEPSSKYTDLISGGFSMAKREFYESTGLQDEALFMYCDELDTMLKAKKCGYKIGVIASEYAWHWHIYPNSTNKRSSASRYLISRNRVYLARKYSSKRVIIQQLLRGLLITPIIYLIKSIQKGDLGLLTDAKYSAVGAVHGLIDRMYTNKYTIL